MRRYVGVVRKASGNDFRVVFPDLPGCSTKGKTMGEARRLAAETLAVHLDALVSDGVPAPEARGLAAIRDDPGCGDATTLILVEAPAKPQ
jgi:predicted RNase H-like HicB family nuclease